jgi:hypothetical protein
MELAALLVAHLGERRVPTTFPTRRLSAALAMHAAYLSRTSPENVEMVRRNHAGLVEGFGFRRFRARRPILPCELGREAKEAALNLVSRPLTQAKRVVRGFARS